MLMIRPLLDRIIGRAAARIATKALLRFVSMTVSKSSSSMRRIRPSRGDAGVVDQHIEPAVLLGDLFDGGGQGLGIGDVAGHRLGRAAGGVDLVDTPAAASRRCGPRRRRAVRRRPVAGRWPRRCRAIRRSPLPPVFRSWHRLLQFQPLDSRPPAVDRQPAIDSLGQSGQACGRAPARRTAPSPSSAISVFIVCSHCTGETICSTSNRLIDAAILVRLGGDVGIYGRARGGETALRSSSASILSAAGLHQRAVKSPGDLQRRRLEPRRLRPPRAPLRRPIAAADDDLARGIEIRRNEHFAAGSFAGRSLRRRLHRRR